MLAAVTPAGAEWTAAQTLSRPHAFVAPSGLGYARGDGLAVWNWTDETTAASAARRGPSGCPGDGSRPSATCPPAPSPGRSCTDRGRVIIATQTDRDGRATLRVRVGTRDGRFGRSVVVARARSIYGHQLVGNASGDAALGWLVGDGTGNVRVFVSVRRRGGRVRRADPARPRAHRRHDDVDRAGWWLCSWPGTRRAASFARECGRARERAFHRVEELPARPRRRETR